MNKPFFNFYTPKPVTPNIVEGPVNTRTAKSILHELSGVSQDTVDQYEQAALQSSDQFSEIVIDLANQHSRQHSELQRLLVEIGGTPKDDGTVSGKIQRKLQKIRHNMTGEADKQIAEEMRSAEQKLAEKYQDVLREELDSETRNSLERHLAEIVENQNRLRTT